ncbi:MAG: Ig-like domain-containing protein [Candidatus Dormiibacterota bacterium]
MRALGTPERRGSRVLRQVGAALVAGAVSLFSGGVIGHALSVSTTTLASGANPSVWGESVTFTATITPVSPAPTGTVTFQDGGANIAGCVNKAVAARVATCATAALTVGSHTVTAVYSGNATYATSTSAPVVQVVGTGTTATALVASANPSVSGQTVTYTATVTAVAPAAGTRTGTVEFQDGGVDIAGCSAKAVSAAGKATCAIAYTGPGSHTITAIYSGDANFSGSTSVPLTQTVNLGTTSTVLTSGTNPSMTGATVTFTANVTATAPASGTRTGTVEFLAGGVDIAGCSAVAVPASGKPTCATNVLPVGTTTITAVYSGDANFAASSAAPLTQTVNQGGTTTKVVSSLNPSSTGVTVTFTATVTATAPATGTRTGTVAFDDGGVGIAGCAAQVLTAAGTTTCATNALTAGAHTITAVYSGDGNFTTSTSPPITQTVLTTTTTSLSSSVNPSVFGQSVQYTATVAGGPSVTGTITFKDGGSNIAGCVAVVVIAGSASCTVSPTAASHTITAVYSGDANNTASTSPAMTQVVTADPTTTAVTATVNPTVFGQSVTFTATVTANAPGSGIPAGKINFQNGGASIGGCGAVTLVAGVATCTTGAITVGSHVITGVFNGSASYLTSTSAPITQTVNPGSTTTAVTSAIDPSVTGQPVTFTATVTVVAPGAGTPTGKVNFEDGGVTIAGCGAKALAAAGTATCAFTYTGAGTHTITAIYTGDTNFAGSTSTNFTQTVNQASTSTAVTSSLNPAVTGQPDTFTATVTAVAPGAGARTGTVVFQDGGITITGCAAQAVSAAGTATCVTPFATTGGHVITAVYSGDGNFTGSASPALTETINPGATRTVVGSSLNPSLPGQTVTYTAVVTPTAPAAGTPTGTVTFIDGASGIAGCVATPLVGGVASCSVAYPAAGTHAITAVYGADLNFTGSTSLVLTQTINQGATVAAVTSSVSPSVSGEGVSYTATVTAVAPASGTPTGTVAFVDGASAIAGCAAQPLVAGVATCDLTYSGVGSHAITGVYSGDASFTTSTSPVFTQTVNQGATATVVVPSVNPSVSGQGVTYTAAVAALAPASGTPTGTATFIDGATPIGGCTAQPLVGGVATCTVAYPGVGAHSITAVYGGDPDFSASTSAATTQTVVQAATSTALASSVNPSVTGQATTLTATVSVTAPGAGSPTGTVDFMDGGVAIAACAAQAVTGGTATCSTSFGAAGTGTLTAIYSGDSDFSASTSPALTQTVNQGATAALVTSSVNPSVPGQMVTFTAFVAAVAPASGTPTGTVTFMDGAAPVGGCGPVLVGGTAACTIVYAGVGSHAITVTYGGDANFTGSASPALTQTITQGATASVVTPSVNPPIAGQGITYTATVSAVAPASGTPTGTVTFQDGGVPVSGCAAQTLVAGTASCTVTYGAAGTHSVGAVYGGDGTFTGSSSPAVTEDVAATLSATTVTSPVNPWTAGDTGLFSATVAVVSPASVTPSGTVTFVESGTPLTGCAAQPVVAGTATCTAVYSGPGTHAITAVYSGNAALAGSTSPEFVLSVYEDPPTPDTGSPPATPSSLGYLAVLGGVVLVFLVGCARLRRRGTGGD